MCAGAQKPATPLSAQSGVTAKMPKVSAIIVAAGASNRMGGQDKLGLRIGSKTVLERSVAALANNADISDVVVVTAADRIEQVRALCAPFAKLRAVVPGGATRVESTRAGVAACAPDTDYYAIHDGARPFVSDALISRVISAAVIYGAAAPGVRVIDTIKRVDEDDTVIGTPDRAALVAVATPQVFEAVLYRAALKNAGDAFDDCQLLERVGRKVQIVEGERDNIKITEPGDVARARFIAGESEMRIGHGYDVHRLVEGRPLILGGVEIPYAKGLLGHSDADVLAHAVTDALFGAAALGDIGSHFPDTDDAYKGADSIALLRRAVEIITAQGYAIGNIDATILCQAPKLRSHIDGMRDSIARACGIETDKVSVKATTEEGLGFTGDGSGIAVHAVALLHTL